MIFLFNANTLVKADSGWDFDYDSGGWNSSGWDSGSSWSSSDCYSSSGFFADLIIVVLIVVFFTMIFMMLAKDKSSVKYRSIYLNESESNNYQE